MSEPKRHLNIIVISEDEEKLPKIADLTGDAINNLEAKVGHMYNTVITLQIAPKEPGDEKTEAIGFRIDPPEEEDEEEYIDEV